MAEKGAPPKVPRLQQAAFRAVRAFTTPLQIDDYVELINPLWSTRELRGRVEEIRRETPDAATVVIRPGYDWPGHEPGQYLRIGIDANGRRHWRAYSLTSDPDRRDGHISITVKNVDEGVVSPRLVKQGKPGDIVSLGGVEGDFTLPEPVPDKLLFVSAGSGITPIMSMLRSLARRDKLDDALLVHSARTPDDVIFGAELRELAEHTGLRLHEQHTGTAGRIDPDALVDLCPDWREREAFLSGPGEMLDTLTEHWESHGDRDRLRMERFQPVIGSAEETGEGGPIRFRMSDCDTESDGTTPILVAGEEAGLELAYGCREGICHTCVGTLRKGRVRDLRTGKVSGQEGDTVRTCINAPEGPVEIEL
jgi:stearoyl-CoA 9-desaturase NADPH oxidoreductase